MLSLPDFKEKKIVFIASDTHSSDLPDDLKFSNDNLVLYKNGQKTTMISCYLLFCVFLIGDMTLTSVLLRKAKKYGISVFMLDNSLDLYGAWNSMAEGNYLMREIQYSMNQKQYLQLSKWIVVNKISNQYQILKMMKLDMNRGNLNSALWNIEKTNSVDSLRGVEGNFSKLYFGSIFGKFGWYRRAPQTKEDITNLLMDIGYTFLFNYVNAILNIFGFDTYKGFYHTLFFQRKSLSCDLMEPMRYLIDKKIYNAYNLSQIREKDFGFKNGVFYLKKFEYRKKYTQLFLEAINERKEDIYMFIRQYYRHLHKPDVYELPIFEIK
jgi:CRISPR-associated protein Cas1